MNKASRWRLPILLALATVPQLPAQTTASFEVASVKPQPWNGQGSVGVFVRGNTLSGEHVCLYDLVEFAWNLRDGQLSGGPAWALHGVLANSDLYQVIGKTASDPAPAPDQIRLMLQALLTDRFQLKVHHLEKNMPVYNLVAAKGGAKLRASAADTKFSMVINSGKPTRIVAAHVPLKMLIDHIDHYTGRPIFDKTGLHGLYDFEMEFSPDGLDAATPDPGDPSIFAALQKQLGLKLEPGMAPFDTVVIDDARKPSGN